MVEPHVFIFLGNDELRKHEQLELLQKKLFPPDIKEFNYCLLYGDDKDLTPKGPKDLKEALSCFPQAGASKRLVVIKMAHKLSKAHQAYLLEECRIIACKTIVVLDIPGDAGKASESFVGALAKAGAQVVRFAGEAAAANAFDLGRAIAARRPESALKILAGLIRYKEKAEKIIGAIFWQWERLHADRRISEENYKRGLRLISEADKRLKSSSSAFAREVLILEALVVRLSSLA
ncbi:MAG: hypothetical protein V1840_00435 [Candidatus Omnitrophota bacterium]